MLLDAIYKHTLWMISLFWLFCRHTMLICLFLLRCDWQINWCRYLYHFLFDRFADNPHACCWDLVVFLHIIRSPTMCLYPYFGSDRIWLQFFLTYYAISTSILAANRFACHVVDTFIIWSNIVNRHALVCHNTPYNNFTYQWNYKNI